MTAVLRTLVALLCLMLAACSCGGRYDDVRYMAIDGVRDTFQVFLYGTSNGRADVCAYTQCDGVAQVTSTAEQPLHLLYTTNPDPALQGDLLLAIHQDVPVTDSLFLQYYVHALSWLSFVWTQNDEQYTGVQYKLHSLVVRGKQSGWLTIKADSDKPQWSLVSEAGDYHFVIYQCHDYDKPDEQQTLFNPDAALLREAHSLYLVPGVAVAADIEYSVWRGGKMVERRTVPNIILGGSEHMASYLLYNTHYTYTFLPAAYGEVPMDVTLDVEEWSSTY